jgi:ribulose-bisphosphate carboxylase large chain
MKLFKPLSEVNQNDYVIATYQLRSTLDSNLRDAAWNLAIGQSVGNPNVRSIHETDELFENHSCIIISDFVEDDLRKKTHGEIKIGFPVVNTDWEDDGISHLLCQLMGGQMDIDVIEGCRLIGLDIPDNVKKHFKGPKYGFSGMRAYTGQYNKPLFGAIIKPKTGISPKILLEMVKELVDGGVDFIKEDEILSNPAVCSLKDRVPLIANWLNNQSRKVVYCTSINADPHAILDRAKFVADSGGNGIHLNVWCGLGAYNSVRRLDLPLYLHFQKSGDKVFTDKSHRFSIAWDVMCQLAGLMGADTIHSGMWGGYMSESEEDLQKTLKVLRDGNVVPALSCGMHAGLIEGINKRFGVDYMANVGGAIHGHPMGTVAGAKAIRQSIDKNYGMEYGIAVNKWGIKS